MYLRTIEIVELLRKQGHSVTVRKRTDGGYLITKIDGKSYKGSSGNNVGRKITGTPLPQKITKQRIKAFKSRESKYRKEVSSDTKTLLKQLKKANKKWGIKSPYKNRFELQKDIEKRGLKEVKKDLSKLKKRTQVSESFKKQFDKTLKAWTENKNIKGKITAETTLKKIEKEGVRAVKRSLKRMENYAKGYANNKNVYWFIQQIEAVAVKFHTDAFQPLIEYCQKHPIMDSDMVYAREILYQIDHGHINPSTGATLMLNVIKRQSPITPKTNSNK